MRKGQNQTVADVVCGLYANRNKWTETVWTLEFKSGRVGFPKSFWESYSAFANTDGGIIVVGVDKVNCKFKCNAFLKKRVLSVLHPQNPIRELSPFHLQTFH